MYFYFNPHTFFIKGKSSSAIYDISRGELYRLDADETRIAEKADNGEVVDGNEPFLCQMADMKLGAFSKIRIFVDKHRAEHTFLRDRMDLNPPRILTAFVRITDCCNLECTNPGFCPACYADEQPKPDKPYEFWENIFTQLLQAGAVSFIITGGNPFLHKDIVKMITFLKEHNATVSVISNCCTGLPKIEGINLIVKTCDIANIKDLNGYIGTYLTYKETPDAAIPENFTRKNVLTDHNIIDSETGLSGCFDQEFHKRQGYDDCLRGCMYVNSGGEIVPCFEQRNVVLGNFEHFTIAYQRLVKEYWNADFQTRTLGKKCAECELYFACRTCSAFNPERSCRYNPEAGCFLKELHE